MSPPPPRPGPLCAEAAPLPPGGQGRGRKEKEKEKVCLALTWSSLGALTPQTGACSGFSCCFNRAPTPAGSHSESRPRCNANTEEEALGWRCWVFNAPRTRPSLTQSERRRPPSRSPLDGAGTPQRPSVPARRAGPGDHGGHRAPAWMSGLSVSTLAASSFQFPFLEFTKPNETFPSPEY